MEAPEKLLDVSGAASLLAVSTWTIRAYIRLGKLHSVRIGRLMRLERQEIRDFIATARVGRPQTGGCTSEDPERKAGV